MVRPLRPLVRPPARLLAPVALCLAVVAGCSGENPYEAARNSQETTTVAPAASTPDGSSVVGDNGFLPERDIGDCVGLLEKPDCGSKEKGGTGTYLTFAVLIAGLGVIFWRISKSIRQRDAVVNAPTAPAAPSRLPADGSGTGNDPGNDDGNDDGNKDGGDRPTA